MPSGVRVDETKRQAITADMNLVVLRRQDPAVENILCSSSHVAVYELPIAGENVGQWQRRDIEGSLFVVSRKSGGASHRVFVINRKSPENFVDDITPDKMTFETAERMIMFQNANGKISGLWFYVADDMKRVYDVMREIAQDTSSSTCQEDSSGACNTGTKESAEKVPRNGNKLKKKSRAVAPENQRLSGEEDSPTAMTSPIASENSISLRPVCNAPSQETHQNPDATEKMTAGVEQSPGNVTYAERRTRVNDVTSAVTATRGDHTAQRNSICNEIDDSLQRFFPNLKLTNGVAGFAPPADATRTAAVMEADDGHSGNAKRTTEMDLLSEASQVGAPPPAPSTSHSASHSTEASRQDSMVATEQVATANGTSVPLQMAPPGVLPVPHFIHPIAAAQTTSTAMNAAYLQNFLHSQLAILQSQNMVLARQQHQLAMQMSSPQQPTVSQSGTFDQNMHASGNSLSQELQRLQQQQFGVQQNIAQVQRHLANHQLATSHGHALPSAAAIPLAGNFPNSVSGHGLLQLHHMNIGPVIAPNIPNRAGGSLSPVLSERANNPTQSTPSISGITSHNAAPAIKTSTLNENSLEACDIGASVAMLTKKLNGTGVERTSLDRSQFKGLLQRLLTDKKLFEHAFTEYCSYGSKRT